MEAPLESSAEEITQLRGCVNDLVRITTLPVLSTGGEPSRIASNLVDALVGMLHLSFAFIQLNDPEGTPILEMTRVAEPFEDSTCAREIGEALKVAVGHGRLWPRKAQVLIGDVKFSLASTRLGLQGELGVVVAGSQKLDFPEQTEALLLDVAANKAAIGLLQVRLLIAQRTPELATTKDELEKSERDSWRIIDSIPEPVATLTKAGDVDMVNRHLLEYFGTTIEEARRWKANDLVHPEDLPHLIDLFTRSIESGSPYESEHRLRRTDGVYRWFQARAFPLRDANGQIVRWCVLLTDINDRKRAEEDLRTSEHSLNLITDTIPAVVWSARPDGSADFFSKHYLDYVGLSAKQLKDWGWTAVVHPDDLNGLVAAWQRIMASEQAGEAEARLRRFDGSYRWFLFRASPMRDESGKIVKWYGANIDIEDRKRGEEALRASELSWRQIVDNIPGLVATMGATGEVKFLNRQTLEYFGKTNEELKNWSLIDVVHPDDLPRVIKARTKSIEAEQIYDVEHRCRRADGVYRWFQVRGLPVRNAEGAITDWYLLLTDIDDRKKADEALRSSERNLSLMINAIPAFMYVLRTDGSVLDANQGVLDYTGVTLEDTQKEDYRTRFFHPEDVERLREERRVALTRAVPFENEQRVLGKDGRYRWFLVRYNPLLDEQGRIDRWYVAAFDIDDRKQAEAQVEQAYLRLAEAQRLSKTGSFITDLLADDHNWSEEAFRIFEFDPAAKVTVQMVRDVIHPEDLPSFDAVIGRGMTGKDADFVFRIVTSRGAVKHIRGMARVIEQVAGRPLFVGALQDVTENKRAEEALRQTQATLERVTRVSTMGELTASLAHEVNQPIAAAITNSNTCLRWLQRDPPDLEEACQAASRSVKDATRAAEIISRVRSLFKKGSPQRQPVDVNEVIKEMIVLVRIRSERHSVAIRTDLMADPPIVMADRVQLQQVLTNLMLNGIEAMTAVDAERELKIKSGLGENSHVLISVSDTGVGLAAQQADHIFNPFFTTKPEGTGMGLTISRSIIEAHGGRLWADATPGRGATFHFSLPSQGEDAQ
jgi:PAS domain S-box-containing protein